jgi:hypothetical protein
LLSSGNKKDKDKDKEKEKEKQKEKEKEKEKQQQQQQQQQHVSASSSAPVSASKPPSVCHNCHLVLKRSPTAAKTNLFFCLFCHKLAFCSEHCRQDYFDQHHHDCVDFYVTKAINNEFNPQFSDLSDIGNIEIVKSRVNIFLTNVQTVVVFSSKTPTHLTTAHYMKIFDLFDLILHELVLVPFTTLNFGKEGLKQLFLIEKEIISANIQILFIMMAESRTDPINRRKIAQDKIFNELMPKIKEYLETREYAYVSPVVALFLKCLLNVAEEQVYIFFHFHFHNSPCFPLFSTWSSCRAFMAF